MAVAALEDAGLRPAARYWERYPARAVGRPAPARRDRRGAGAGARGLVCDEPVSGLDVSVRAQVIHLLMELKREQGLSLIFITHDVGLAWAMCDRVAVMYLGRVVEQGTTEQVLANPQHPYTQVAALGGADALPAGRAERESSEGELPDASRCPSGCRFHPRCPRAFDRCPVDDPHELIPGRRRPGPRPGVLARRDGRAGRLGRDQAAADRLGDRLRERAGVELGHRVADVRAHGRLGDEQPAGDVGRPVTVLQQTSAPRARAG